MYLLLILLVIIMVLIALERLGRGAGSAGKAAFPAQERGRLSGRVEEEAGRAPDLLGGEPLVAEFGELRLMLTLTINPAREADLAALRACGAVIEGVLIDDCPVLQFSRIPSVLLQQLFPQIGSTDCINVELRDENPGRSLHHFFGTWPQIRSDLRSFAMTRAGSRQVAQERGDLAEGRYFTPHMFILIDQHRLGAYRVTGIPRERLRTEIDAQIAWVEACLAGGAAADD